ncbi:succinyl-diaminopimelate desuccinylase [Halorubrum aquaticum]|uniref:Succinyl-diaminopimelate desuccinylase n=1 Tax=Halorubrum aquaticum TaxID=387340 RepID=A0A1I3BPD9_9EURY|nr:M20 family metallopeptidase [Halorubrum aquaticum]SFH63956.1 succinyl-diaminopimelate desuccinylase [Halorubrum aquaticum]
MSEESAAERSAELEELARELVCIPTENPPGNEEAAAEFVYEWFREEGIDATLLEEPDPDRPQVGARVGEDGPTVVLNGHLDVVPAGDPEEWTTGPYEGVVEDGRLRGRGSADMKTGVALAMLVARDLAPEIRSGELSGSVVVHAAMGEETADPGTRTLLERGFDGDYGVVLEPTDFRVATSTKGLSVYRIAVEGVATHASQPDAGTNAIDEVRPLLDAIDEYDAELREREGSLCGGAFATVTGIEAGTGTNLAVIPDRAELVLDRRVLPGEDPDAVDAEVEALLDRVREEHGVETAWTRIQTYASSSIPVDHPLATSLRDGSVEAVGADGGVGEPWGIEAATDARNFVNDAGIPAVTWGPGDLDQAHTVDESIDLADADIARDVLEDVTRAFIE